jgi:formylglycine-generating enzyme required for sulfatase activity
MNSALTDAGFETTALENATVLDFANAVESFLAKVQPDDICLLYFTGYAIQSEDHDFLLPVDFQPDSTGNLIARAYEATNFAKELDLKKAALKLIFLEGARFIDRQVQEVSIPGLLMPDITDVTDTLIGLPAGTNQVIGTRNEAGLFTQVLAQEIRKSGSCIFQFMPAVKKAVAGASKGTQQPSWATNLTKDFCFIPPVSPGPQPGDSHQNRKDREDYAWIPPGKFLMGCVPGDQRCDKNEKPQHELTVTKGFWMGQNEVRVVSYQRYVSADPRNRKMPAGPFWDTKWRQEDRPISNMRWEDAASYCQWAGGRLPTEAEWEYAARGGVQNQIYPLNSENSRDKANFVGKKGNDIFEYTGPVRSFDPLLPYQLYDMAGNVWEFVSDYYDEDYFRSSPASDPKGPESGKQHVVRGGSFDSDPREHLRISFRKSAGSANNIGFRCVLGDSPDTHRGLQIP